jgi:hypothetical protein
MLKRFLTAATLVLAASLSVVATARATVVTFEDQAAFRCDANTTEHDGGLSFAQNPAGPFFTCFYSQADPADFRVNISSTVMAVGFTDTTITADNGDPFDLKALKLAAGPWTVPGDTTFVEGFVHGGGTVTTTLALNAHFRNYVLGWQNLDSVFFSRPQANDGYVAFDSVRYFPVGADTGGVPEPAIWAMMLLGFTAAGVMLRRARQLAHTYVA